MHPHSHYYTTGAFATMCFTSVWQGLDALWRNGPGWEIVPAIVGSIASLFFAVNSYLSGRQTRRHAEDLHRAVREVAVNEERLRSAAMVKIATQRTELAASVSDERRRSEDATAQRVADL